MDYEKEYKDALERAKQIKDGKGNWRFSDLSEIVPAVTEIFPVLAESEDERIRKFIAETVFRHYGDSQEYLDVLAYLEKQKDQKPAWSEEDEKMRNKIIWLLSGFIYPNSLYGEDAKECIDWIKSPRSRTKSSDNWKPSEKQMEAMEEVRTIFHNHHLWDEINPILYDYEELMRDLQKLIQV